jgi:hypothetical protein
MGIWRFAGAFAVVKRQSEGGSKIAGMHVSQPMNRRVLAVVVWFVIYIFLTIYFLALPQSHSNLESTPFSLKDDLMTLRKIPFLDHQWV